tara:strand:- start:371 stop:1015 length:645 start_codon:yes stop_codon:yes gene_type:complete
MKFQIIPKSCFNLKTYIDNIDNKKRIIIKETLWSTDGGGWSNWKTHVSNSFEFFQDCKEESELQSKINELTKKIIPISKNQSHENYNEIKDNFITSDFDSLTDSKELAKSLDLEEEDFIIENNCNFKEANFMSAHNLEDKDWERTTSGNVTLEHLILNETGEEKNISTKINLLNDGTLKITNNFLSTELSEIGFEFKKNQTIYSLPLRIMRLEE